VVACHRAPSRRFLAGVIALTQNGPQTRPSPTRRSAQLGFMFLALGSGTMNHRLAAWAVAGRHLSPGHANAPFFKALLFLGAGMRHALHGQYHRHAQIWRPAQGAARHPLDLPLRVGSAGRAFPLLFGLLEQGRNPRRERMRRGSTAPSPRFNLRNPVLYRLADRGAHRVLTTFRAYFQDLLGGPREFRRKPNQHHGHERAPRGGHDAGTPPGAAPAQRGPRPWPGPAQLESPAIMTWAPAHPLAVGAVFAGPHPGAERD